MKKRRILLLLSFSGVVIIGFFLFADLLAPHPSLDDSSKDGSPKESASAKDALMSLMVLPERQEVEQKTDSSGGRLPEPGPTLHNRFEDEDDYDEEEAEELAEAEEEAQEVAEELAEETEAEEDEEEDESLDPEEEEALDQFLAQITLENWRQARIELLSAYKDGTITQNLYVENEFWSRVGEIGGQKVADELLDNSDPAYTKILGGWGKADPQALLDYFSELDLKDPKIQKYLDQTNNRELPFIDQFSSGILDGLVDGNNPEKIDDDQLNGISEILDYFLDGDPMKGESLMREFTERVIKDRDLDALKEWVSGYEEPELQAATAQRIIESGAFDEEPLEAVKFANSLASDKAKRSGLSSAYARLASGVNGHNPKLTAQELNAMQDGIERDFALNGFAHGLVHSDPERALQWANSISNENFRKVVTKNISKRIKVELPGRSGGQE
jgi:hypothetical protein